jgi:hypothetical protein
MFLQSPGQNAFERFIIAVLLKERQTRHGSIKDVIDETTRGNAGFARHGPKLAREGAVVNEKELRPLFLLIDRSIENVTRLLEGLGYTSVQIVPIARITYAVQGGTTMPRSGEVSWSVGVWFVVVARRGNQVYGNYVSAGVVGGSFTDPNLVNTELRD